MAKDKRKAYKASKAYKANKELSKEDIIAVLKTGDKEKIEEVLNAWNKQEHFYSKELPF